MKTIVGLVCALRSARGEPSRKRHARRRQPNRNTTSMRSLEQTQNPVADLTAVPLQFNFNSGGDLEDRSLFLLNFQPVIPFKKNDWNTVFND